jgi:Tol biopolymer transport system component
MAYKEVQLTTDSAGHCLNTTQCFSPDDNWIVFDGRNDDSQIAANGEIAIVNTITGEIKTMYRVSNQTAFGPGTGAATFSPVRPRVLFIHGIRNASKENPYSFTRRTGVAVDIDRPNVPLFMDARDITPPFTPGALRGGTHAHTWSGDGKLISYTYNDYILEQGAKNNPGVRDLRTIGIMFPAAEKVVVDKFGALENNDGEMYAVLLATVTENPGKGTDEIDKAFDEGWIGQNGYVSTNGVHQKYAIAFQGNVRNENGDTKTEVFVVDIPDSVIQSKINPILPGTGISRLPIAPGIRQRRITFTKDGISGPRHWLRSTADGSLIAFLAKDSIGIAQIYAISPNGGDAFQITDNPFPVTGPFNWSPDGRKIAYPADNSIFMTDLQTRRSYRITTRTTDAEKPVGAVSWSNDGTMLCFNRYVKNEQGNYLQIFLLKEQAK